MRSHVLCFPKQGSPSSSWWLGDSSHVCRPSHRSFAHAIASTPHCTDAHRHTGPGNSLSLSLSLSLSHTHTQHTHTSAIKCHKRPCRACNCRTRPRVSPTPRRKYPGSPRACHTGHNTHRQKQKQKVLQCDKMRLSRSPRPPHSRTSSFTEPYGSCFA